MSRPRQTKQRTPKPCPRCYAPMRATPEGFSCARHGIPELERTEVVPTNVKQPRVRLPKAPRIRVRREPREKREPAPRQRWGNEVRYPSDLKLYPLPPSADGRDNALTSKDSPTTARSALTPELLAEAMRRTEAGETPWQIAGEMWERAGYNSRHSCKGSLYRALRKAGVIA